MATVTLKSNEFRTNGQLPAVGASAPDFKLVDTDLGDRSLADYQGKKKLISIVPSLDTHVCAISTKKFNDFANERDDVVFLVVSADLPFAQGRFCKNEKTKSVATLSMMRSRNFAKDYGVLLQDGPLAGVTARAVVVVDENNKVVHAQLVEEIADEPDYEAALSALNG